MKRTCFVITLMMITIAAVAAPFAITHQLTQAEIDAFCVAQGGCGAASGGGPGPGPGTGSDPWNGVCPGFAHTRVLPLDWQTPRRLFTQDFGHFMPDDAIVVIFTTGSASSAGSLPRLTAAEWNSSPSSRTVTLSPTPCDFAQQPIFGANIHGNSITAIFALGTGSGFGFYPVIPANTTWYLNIKNDADSTCRQNGVCDMFVDLIKVGGL